MDYSEELQEQLREGRRQAELEFEREAQLEAEREIELETKRERDVEDLEAQGLSREAAEARVSRAEKRDGSERNKVEKSIHREEIIRLLSVEGWPAVWVSAWLKRHYDEDISHDALSRYMRKRLEREAEEDLRRVAEMIEQPPAGRRRTGLLAARFAEELRRRTLQQLDREAAKAAKLIAWIPQEPDETERNKVDRSPYWKETRTLLAAGIPAPQISKWLEHRYGFLISPRTLTRYRRKMPEIPFA